MLVRVCDRCGKRIEDFFRITIKLNDNDLEDTESADLCRECTAELERFLKEPQGKPGDKTNAEAPEKTEEKPKKKNSKRRPLDMGKVMALRRAGWTLSAVAEEMGCSPQTIINRLKEKST